MSVQMPETKVTGTVLFRPLKDKLGLPLNKNILICDTGIKRYDLLAKFWVSSFMPVIDLKRLRKC
jgi:hypothetical protein